MQDRGGDMIFFTADTHFGHKNLIDKGLRQFNSVSEMDEFIISNWNKVIEPKDEVYHLGDFCWIPKVPTWEYYLSQLNGKITLIKGNHDLRRSKIQHLFVEVEYLKQVEWNHQKITLCHYAMRTWDRSHFNSWQLFGHSHGSLEPIGKQIDVGIDANGFYPISIEQVAEKMLLRPDNPNIDHHRSDNGKENNS
jgi:calcineurin-like phosphoesterase family protein